MSIVLGAGSVGLALAAQLAAAGRADFFFAGVGFFSALGAAASAPSDFCADLVADCFAALFAALAFAGVSAPAAPAAFAGVSFVVAFFLRPKRLPRGGAFASSSRQVSSVTALGSVSFGMRALRLPSVMYGP